MKGCGALAVCLLLLLTGCAPVAREPDNLALVRVLGIDADPSVVLTAVCARDKQGDVRRGFARGESFEQARERIPWSGTAEELSLTGVSYLLIGPGGDLERLLYSVLEDADLGAAAAVCLTRYSAGQVLAACEDPAADLELLSLQGKWAPTAAQAAAALSTNGVVTLPCLEVREGRLKKEGEIQWQRGE